MFRYITAKPLFGWNVNAVKMNGLYHIKKKTQEHWGVINIFSHFFLVVFPLFSVIFEGSDKLTLKIWPYSSLTTENQYETIPCFSVFIFSILSGHIEMKILTEHASLQSHTKAYDNTHDMLIWRKFDKNWRGESAAKEIIKKAVMTSQSRFI